MNVKQQHVINSSDTKPSYLAYESTHELL